MIGKDADALTMFAVAKAHDEPELSVELGSEMVSVVTKQPHSQRVESKIHSQIIGGLLL